MASTVLNQNVAAQSEGLPPDNQWPLWEVFTQSEITPPRRA